MHGSGEFGRIYMDNHSSPPRERWFSATKEFMIKRQLEDLEVDCFLRGFASLPLSRIWFGDYLALYLELGRCIGRYKHSGRSEHERHIFAGYDWTLSNCTDGTTLRSDLTEERVLQMLNRSQVLSVKLDSSNELLVTFDNQCQICTRRTDRTDWSLYESPDKYLSIENGFPILEITTRD